jgi:hypothetical protein
MRTVCLSLLLLGAVLVLPGCRRAKIEPLGLTNRVEIDGLAVSVEIPRAVFTVGEQFDVKVTARNTTRKPIRILATNSALVYLRIQRFTGLSCMGA